MAWHNSIWATHSMAGQNRKGWSRLQAAFLNSLKGFRATWQHEEAFRQEVVLFVVAAPLGLVLGQGGVEKGLLVGSLLLVLIVEMLNTCVEIVVDRISYERHELSGRAKDVDSAAVLASLVFASLIWALILLPHYV
jgi:diacylglycerol kinase (ATP)